MVPDYALLAMGMFGAGLALGLLIFFTRHALGMPLEKLKNNPRISVLGTAGLLLALLVSRIPNSGHFAVIVFPALFGSIASWALFSLLLRFAPRNN